MRFHLSSALIYQRSISAQPAKVTLPTGAPVCKSWYVDRHQIVQDVYDRLCLEGSPGLIALVGGRWFGQNHGGGGNRHGFTSAKFLLRWDHLAVG